MDTKLFAALVPHITTGMSTFQMENFVINDSITPFRQLRQAIVEAKSRIETSVTYELDLDELLIKHEVASSEADALVPGSAQERLKRIDIKRLEFEMNRKRSTITQLAHEAEFFLNSIKQIVESNFGGVEQAIAALGDPATRYAEEADFWTKKLARSVYADLVNYGTVSKGVLESITCLPLEQRQAIVQQAALQQHTFAVGFKEIKDTVLAITD